jgi:hypothetical protein
MIPQRIVRFLQGRRFVYSTQAWQKAAALITWRIPITSPPVTAESFQPHWMEGKKLLIFKLHGYEDDPNWYGLDRAGQKPIALTPAQVVGADLTGAIVIALVCHGAGSVMQEAFFTAGARAFFGSHEEVRGRETRPGEADWLVFHILTLLAGAPQDLERAFAEAKDLYRAAAEPWTEHDQYTCETFTLEERSAKYG